MTEVERVPTVSVSAARPAPSVAPSTTASPLEAMKLDEVQRSRVFLRTAFANVVAQPEALPSQSGMWRALQGLLPHAQLGRRFERLFAQPAFRTLTAEQRARCRQWVESHRGEPLSAVFALTAGDAVGDPVEEAQQCLAAVARDPSTWSRQLAVLRAVQTLTVIDLQVYCDVVRELGEY